MPRLLLATTNQAKQREYRRLLADLPVELVVPADLGTPPTVAETGDTFEANALLKARAYAAWSGLPALADDGGLEIDALGGEPGVRSARWLGREASDEELIAYTLARMLSVPGDQRGASMRVVCALVDDESEPVVGEGVIRGAIGELASAKRDPGFPFRSVFVVDATGRYYVDDHEQLNHRRDALVPVITRLLTLRSFSIECAPP